VHRLQGTQYDAILDTQGLFKSALIARIARGRRHGLNWRSSREPLRLFYDRVHDVPWDAHAVERNRRLCGLAMGYRVDGPPVYGLRAVPARMPWLPSNRYAVLLHGTSHPSKLWPESDWIALGLRLSSFGLDVVLPWGSDDERERAQRIAAALPRAVVLSKLGIDELAAVMAGAAAVIGVDTGLTHLAAALGLCVVGIYGATDPGATGVYAPGPVVNVGGRRRFPSVDEAISALVTLGVFPAASGRKGGA
jgi:heptosyltransferase-1